VQPVPKEVPKLEVAEILPLPDLVPANKPLLQEEKPNPDDNLVISVG
jgi:hypothetical protein